jgi:hypothetical protein
MATTTPLNGWPVPTSTDYVKDGAVSIEALGDAIDTSVGTGLLDWTAYTPTFINLTLGNGTIDFKYAKLGKTVNVRGQINFGSTTSVTGAILISLPVNAFTASGGPIIGNSYFNDASLSTTNTGYVQVDATTRMRYSVIVASGTYSTISIVNATVPFTWANTDSLNFTATYQAA